jgi:VanZ family protein
MKSDSTSVGPGRSTRLILALLLGYAAVLLAEAWWPLHLQLPGADSARGMESIWSQRIVPYRPHSLESYARKLAAFVPLGTLLVAGWGFQRSASAVFRRTLALSAALSAVMSAGQLLTPGKVLVLADLPVHVAGALIGASPAWYVHWPRRLLGILTAACALGFLFAATLPWHFSLSAASFDSLARRFEWSPWRKAHSLSVLREWAMNGLITLPLGLLCAVYVLRASPGWRALTVATLLGFGCSVVVECVQCFLPHRTPSLIDVTWNTLGALAGAAVALFLERRRQASAGT